MNTSLETIAVTGCAGLIGVNLCERLVEQYNVLGLDNLSLGTLENVKHLREHENFTFKYCDIARLTEYGDLTVIPNEKIKAIFHLAANSDISNSNAEKEYRNTFLTTLEVLKFCQKHEIKELIFASSGSVYGEAYKYIPSYSEGFGPLIPVSHYGAAKLASENFISSFSYEFGIKAYICRLPNVIGTPATHGVILDFFKKLKKDYRVLEVLGSGFQTKPYMHVKEIIDAMLFIWKNAPEQLNIYNIVPVGHTQVSNIAEWVTLNFPNVKKPVIQYGQGDTGWLGDVPHSKMDGTKLRKLGYTNNLTSDEAVKKAIPEIFSWIIRNE